MEVSNEIAGTIQMKPSELYPLTTIASINPQTLKEAVGYLERGADIRPVRAIEYIGDLYILDGDYEMLAANILKKDSIAVQLVDRSSVPFWNNDQNIENALEAVGISALYDFECIGNFTYDKYPDGYRRK